MKKSIYLLAAAALGFLTPLTGSLSAQEAAPKPQWVKDFNNLPEQQRTKFAEAFQEATRKFNQKRVFEALQTMQEAEEIFGQHPQVKNLMGACYVEFRDFEKASAFFEEALELSPGNMSVRFNVAEVAFVRSQWARAIEQIEALLVDMKEVKNNTRRVLEFKVFISAIKSNQSELADKYAALYSEDDDSPYFYLVKAVRAFEAGDESKAQDWVRAATTVYGRHPNANQELMAFKDALIEADYLKSFYGADDVVLEEDS